jgi:hypothetical protein
MNRIIATGLFAIVTLTVVFPAKAPAAALSFSKEKAGFSVKIKDHISPYKVLGVYVMPGEELKLETISKRPARHYTIKTAAGKVKKTVPGKWVWQAPDKAGLYPITLRDSTRSDKITLNVFVMVPSSHMKGEHLNGYRIGKYPAKPKDGLAIYQKPRGFIEVTKENENTLVAPHLTLKQFLCKQKGGYPKYVVLQEKLLLKLELLLTLANKEKFKASTFTVMSGYRTPYYNKAIGNVGYSAHLFGLAADIFIDEQNADGKMDDLNRDGKINYHDAAKFYNMVEHVHAEPWYKTYIGGLGKYKATPSHGPFVHVDVRGFKARWG